jgi:hypothetical protein
MPFADPWFIVDPSVHLPWYLASLDDFLSLHCDSAITATVYGTRATAVTQQKYCYRLLQGLAVVGAQTETAREGSVKKQRGEGKL